MCANVCVQTFVCVCMCEHSIVPDMAKSANGSFKHDVMQLSGDSTLCPQVLM